MDGIQAAKQANPSMKLSINCVLTKMNRDEIKGMIRLADKLGVSITFESLNTHMPFSTRDASSFKLPPEDESKIFKQIRSYKKKGYRINNSFAYLDTFIGGKKRYECHSLGVGLCMQSNGDVRVCLSQQPLGNLTKTSIGELLKMKEYKEYQRQSLKCCICNDYGTVENSHLWRFNPQALLGAACEFLTN